MTCLMWFRDDLRLHDNQALSRAAEAASLGDAPLVAVVLDEPAYPGTRPLGGATTWWRERSLYALARDICGRLGFDLTHESSGGGSDGNFTGAMGVPTLDSIGVRGKGLQIGRAHV